MRRWLGASVVLVVYVAAWDLATLDWAVESHSRAAGLVFFASTLVVPCVLLGALIARWWAPTVVVALIALPLSPDRCVWRQTSTDSFGGVCSGFGDELAVIAASVFAAVLVGAVIATALRWVRTWPQRTRIDAL